METQGSFKENLPWLWSEGGDVSTNDGQRDARLLPFRMEKRDHASMDMGSLWSPERARILLEPPERNTALYTPLCQSAEARVRLLPKCRVLNLC